MLSASLATLEVLRNKIGDLPFAGVPCKTPPFQKKAILLALGSMGVDLHMPRDIVHLYLKLITIIQQRLLSLGLVSFCPYSAFWSWDVTFKILS